MLTVTITADDIEKGVSGDPHSCPVALALRRAYPRRYVAVGLVSARIEDCVFDLGGKGRLFIEYFDNDRESVKPISFAMREIPFTTDLDTLADDNEEDAIE